MAAKRHPVARLCPRCRMVTIPVDRPLCHGCKRDEQRTERP